MATLSNTLWYFFGPALFILMSMCMIIELTNAPILRPIAAGYWAVMGAILSASVFVTFCGLA